MNKHGVSSDLSRVCCGYLEVIVAERLGFLVLKQFLEK
jgi:hypothetical protein